MSLWLGLDNDLSPPGVTVKSHAEDVGWQLSVVVVTVDCNPGVVMIKTQARVASSQVYSQVSLCLVCISLWGRERKRIQNKMLSSMMTSSMKIILQRKKKAICEMIWNCFLRIKWNFPFSHRVCKHKWFVFNTHHIFYITIGLGFI